jgi:2-polyprenyl-3-methyl-5-hydroxy-6-metoxy-1,4-benzoquinol methylase
MRNRGSGKRVIDADLFGIFSDGKLLEHLPKQASGVSHLDARRFFLARQREFLHTALMNETAASSRAPGVFDFVVREAAARARVMRLVEKFNEIGGSYHQLDFGGGLLLGGHYDMKKYLPYYRFPEDLQGKQVLDVGTGPSGFFALECCRRGAAVTAIDIWEDQFLEQLIQEADLPIRYLVKSIYDLDADFGQFDLVVCGSLLVHLPDQFGAIQRLRSVCRHQAVISTGCPEDSASSTRAICEFIGQKAVDGEIPYWAYWNVSATALEKMLIAADFRQVEGMDHFALTTEPTAPMFYQTPHVIATGIV